jgi:hypothetical protein
LRAVGLAANGMITSSRRRLLARLRAGDADCAALEVEEHPGVLYFTGRLAACGRLQIAVVHAPGPFGKRSSNPNGRWFTRTM